MEPSHNVMMAVDYLARAGLPPCSVILERLGRILPELAALAEGHPPVLATDDRAALYRYRVPRLSDDGSCSLQGEMEVQPFDLADWLGGATDDKLLCLWRLNRLLDRVVDMTGVDWVGIYQVRSKSGERKLVKLAYRGAPSRAVFPLTPDFAARSNNCAVGLSGRARLIPDIQTYLAGGGVYYQCDGRVRSEACLPLFGEFGDVLGIVDAEAFVPEFFQPLQLNCFIALAVVSARFLPA